MTIAILVLISVSFALIVALAYGQLRVIEIVRRILDGRDRSE